MVRPISRPMKIGMAIFASLQKRFGKFEISFKENDQENGHFRLFE